MEKIEYLQQKIAELEKENEQLKSLYDEKHRLIYENISELVCLINPDGKCFSASPSVKKLLGYSVDELIGINPFDLIHPEDMEKEITKKMGAIINGEQVFLRYRILTKNGEYKWFETIPKLVFNNGNEVEFIITSSRDISERMKTVEALFQLNRSLLQNEKRLKAMLNNSLFGIATSDLLGNLTGVNPSFCKMTGYSEDELLSMNYKDFTNDNNVDYERHLLDLIKKREIDSYILEKQYSTKNRGLVWVNIAISVFRDEKDRINGFIGIISDIDDKKKNEENLRKLNTAVTQSPAAIVIIDTRGSIEYVNPEFTKITGYSYEEAIGNNPRILKSGYQTKEFYIELWNQISSGKVWNGELLNKCKNGKLFWENAVIAPIKDDKGNITNYVAVKQNITERKEQEEKLKKSEKHLRESNAAKDKFFSIIAHELRNPFNTLLTMSEFVVKNYNQLTPESILSEIESINYAANHSYKLLENLLEWSRVQLGSTTYNPEEYDISELAVNNIYLLKKTAEAKGILLINEVETGTYATFDYQMINTVIRNLISNAIKFSSRDDCITISSKTYKNRIVVAVSDTGIGISKENQKLLFQIDKNLSIKGTNNEKGTGLGLILSKDYVEKNGGEIWVESGPELGSTFYFSLHASTQAKENDYECKTAINTIITDLSKVSLQSEFNKNFSTKFENLLLNRNINSIHEFAEELEAYSIEKGLDSLQIFSNEMIKDTQEFNIERLSNCLNFFKKLLEKTKD